MGDKLLPRQAEDLEKKPENLHKAVYATNVKEIAIAMAIISCKGVYGTGLKFKKKPFGIIYDGWPKQKFIYLYILPVNTFQKSGEGGRQWASFEPVKPLKVEKLSVKDNLDLVRKASKVEVDRWLKKYGFELFEDKLG